jgi:hypothetical protein
MDSDGTQLTVAVICGLVVMILWAVFTRFILDFLPVGSPFIGGLAAGFAAGGGYLGGARVGAIAGALGAVVVVVDLVLFAGFLRSAVPVDAAVVGLLFIVVAIIFFPVLGAIGGIFGGLIRSGKANP